MHIILLLYFCFKQEKKTNKSIFFITLKIFKRIYFVKICVNYFVGKYEIYMLREIINGVCV